MPALMRGTREVFLVGSATSATARIGCQVDLSVVEAGKPLIKLRCRQPFQPMLNSGLQQLCSLQPRNGRGLNIICRSRFNISCSNVAAKLPSQAHQWEATLGKRCPEEACGHMIWRLRLSRRLHKFDG